MRTKSLMRIFLVLTVLTVVFGVSACNKNGPIPETSDMTVSSSDTSATTQTSDIIPTFTKSTTSGTGDTNTAPTSESSSTGTDPMPPAINYLTGLPLKEGDDGNHRPTMVVINNIKVSLPQSGLEAADVIFEVEAEAGITRLLALYYDPTDIPKIGTVRSTRSPFVNIALGLDAVMFHAGGSPQSYEDMAMYSLDHIDYNVATYYYDKDRQASGYPMEHTLYTTGARLANAWRELEAKGARTAVSSAHSSPFNFYEEDTTPISGFVGGKVVVKYSTFYQPFLRYDPVSGLYLRWEFGNYHRDESTGNQLAFKNVIVLSVTSRTIDSEGRQQYDDIGTGTGYFLTNGVAVSIKWSKASVYAPLELTYEDGTPLLINKGKTFVAYANGLSRITISE